MVPSAPTAYRVVTPRLVIRCYDPVDAPALVEAMAAGVEHLLPWMPWAALEPQSLDEKIALLRGFRADFDRDQNYVFGAFDRADERRLVGGTGVHLRIGPGAGEVGYWVRAGEERKGLATEMATAMTQVGFRLRRFARMAIHCDARNLRSAAIPPKLGYRFEGTLKAGADHGDGPRGDLSVYGMTAAEFATSPAAKLHVEAFDAAGRRLEL